jgi:lysophospholipase L1-like esterase
MKHWIIFGAIGLVGALLLLIIIDFLIIRFSGSPVAAPSIPRGPGTTGSGPALNYVVLGDSTAIGQGAEYTQSYAYQSAQHLAKDYTVTFTNIGVSGARTKDVLEKQLPKVTSKPDIALIAVGANDVTHLTKISDVQASTEAIVNMLRIKNPSVKIIITGSPAMGSVPRFPWPIKQLAGARTNDMNTMFKRLVHEQKITLAPIAAKTGAAFQADPTLFAADKFHPNARGYALWTPVINNAADQALDK